MAIYYKESLNVHEYHPSVPPEFSYLSSERQWLLIEEGRTRVAVLSCYLACISTSSDFKRWNFDLYSMMINEATHLKSMGFALICLG